MKSILFDVDGVFLSEERCFDTSALTIEALLKSEHFLGLDKSFKLNTLSDETINNIRSKVFNNDLILNRLKSMGLNSNWDMLFVVFCIHFIQLIKQFNFQEIKDIIEDNQFSAKSIQGIQSLINRDFKIDYELPMNFINHSQGGKNNIYAELEQYAKKALNVNDARLFKLKGPLWFVARDLYQELYMGSELFEQVEEKPSNLDGINGFIYYETVLRPIEEIKSLLNSLKEKGYHLAIATGRPRTETLVPFESLGLKAFFSDNHIVTASDVMEAENEYPDFIPLGKPNPFCYIATLYGNNKENYKQFITQQDQIVNKEDVIIVGDSLADLFCAKQIGATFIGTLTGLKGQEARKELEHHEADYIVDHIGLIKNILLKG
ncbi:HAD family hydrolase [Staphylococcus haemolyticus]|uniref:HAD family hydrolase n=2 Tax=Staphylococcus haemolyticus TaxID=1283 RepID=UPI000D1D7A94|nr:HAD hydrolase-like protein [Staphylococcus haemolyticus]PTK59807.1 HAD family hydrolase [Staphylococcus haemolyticus]PTK87902.1 HAD family hydrolase [Staphylococcus haemolyticus]